jgi:3-hydroxyisobutyrate dehydrogenase-like beta-hydroxyacid dehydrogenase
MATTTIGFIGLGAMGKGMATSILKKQCKNSAMFQAMYIYDMNVNSINHFLENDSMIKAEKSFIRPASSLLDISNHCNIILLSLPEDAVVQTVNKIMENKNKQSNLTIIDTSTTSIEISKDCSKTAHENDANFIDAPISGLPERAVEGALVSMVGGPSCILHDEIGVKEVIQSYSKEDGGVVHVGNEIGSGQICKSLNNVIYNISIAAMAESLPLAMKLGLDPEKVIQVVSNSSGSSFGFNKWSIECINRNFRDGYAMGEAVKDWHLLEKISKEKINTISSSETSSALGPVAAAAQNVYFDTLNEIDDAKDSHKGIMIKLHEKRLGVKVIKQK